MYKRQLYQIDLLHGSKNRITEREYWAHKKGQAKLDKENAALAAEGKPVKQTKFETDKAKLRQTIRNAMSEATTFDEFSALLLQQGVTVKESRGRLSYLTPDRTKPITARKPVSYTHLDVYKRQHLCCVRDILVKLQLAAVFQRF